MAYFGQQVVVTIKKQPRRRRPRLFLGGFDQQLVDSAQRAGR
jgi:hypothetical protein